MPTTPEFKEAYEKLNLEQKKAVDTIDGPVMVVAGPGTGKTQILTLRIANILLKTDTEPENILALTFTESGVQSMRRRLVDLIGSPAYHVEIKTFHGFSNDIIKNNPEEFPHIIGAVNISNVDQIRLIEEIVLDLKLNLLKPFGDTFYFVRSIASSIDELKREGVTPKDFKEIVKKEWDNFKATDDLYHEKGAHKGKMKGKYKDLEKQIKKNEELSLIYDEYQNKLREGKRYDYNDMIIETLEALRSNEDLLLTLQEKFQYILVDEHQDTNNAQNKVLELLASHWAPRPNIFIVGDEKQSIFRFQGASLENFYYFKNLYPEAELVTLKQNYRSGQSILDSAHSLITSDDKLEANVNFSTKPIEVFPFSETVCEVFSVVSMIKEQLSTGVSAEEVAVLYRENRDAFELAQMLEARGVPFQIESDQDVFTHQNIKKIITIARAVLDYGDDRSLAEMLHIDLFDLSPLDIFKLIKSADSKRKYNLFDVILKEKLRKDLDLEKPDAVAELGTNLAHWVKRSKNTDLLRLFQEIVRESGLLQSILSSDDAQEELDVLDSFFDEVRSIISSNPEATLKEFFNFLDTVRAHGMFVKKKRAKAKKGFVRLMTAHRSKGLEFEYVYIIGAFDGKWGNKKRPELLKLLFGVYDLTEKKEALVQDKNDDDRRLFYVALTRAKKHVRISYARENEDGREQLPSQFVEEIDKKLKSVVDTGELEKDFKENRSSCYQKKQTQKTRKLSDPEYIKDLFVKRGLSVTALNNYLKCPWTYFYRNLVRLPEPVQSHQMYGSAVHSVLDRLFTKLRFGENLSKDDFINLFKKEIRNFPFKESDLERYEERGEEALGGWYDAYANGWITNTMTEFAIRGVQITPEITLTGKLDKLEFISESEVIVVDYKTGNPKTRNMILGKTKSSDGGIWRQLVFYKLLLDKYKEGAYRMVSGQIDFVEPDPKNGNYRKEEFSVTADDVEELEKTIKQVGKEILSLDFWDKKCDDKDCQYCALKNEL